MKMSLSLRYAWLSVFFLLGCGGLLMYRFGGAGRKKRVLTEKNSNLKGSLRVFYGPAGTFLSVLNMIELLIVSIISLAKSLTMLVSRSDSLRCAAAAG